MQLRLFERRSSYSFFALVNQTPELFFAPPGRHRFLALRRAEVVQWSLPHCFRSPRVVNL